MSAEAQAFLFIHASQGCSSTSLRAFQFLRCKAAHSPHAEHVSIWHSASSLAQTSSPRGTPPSWLQHSTRLSHTASSTKTISCVPIHFEKFQPRTSWLTFLYLRLLLDKQVRRLVLAIKRAILIISRGWLFSVARRAFIKRRRELKRAGG